MNGIGLMTTALVAARERLDDATQNLANVQSGGFQRRIAHVGLGPGGLTVIHERDSSHGPLERTGRALDLATAGEGGFFVRDPSGAALLVRSASLTANADGTLADERGRAVLGENGPVRASSNATVDAAGVLHDGARAVRLRTAEGTTLRDGFLERPNVDAIGEMVGVLDAQRAFETAQKALSAMDDARAKDASDVGRVKS